MTAVFFAAGIREQLKYINLVISQVVNILSGEVTLRKILIYIGGRGNFNKMVVKDTIRCYKVKDVTTNL